MERFAGMTCSPCQRMSLRTFWESCQRSWQLPLWPPSWVLESKIPSYDCGFRGLLLCIALSLTLLHSWNVSCKCFNERISEVAMPTYFFLSSTSTLTTSARTATKTALPMFTHIPYSILGLNETTDKFFTCKIARACSPMPQSFEQCDF